jgi:glyoxylase-like metal-dependent hydrolase (beta-lactamase superfamily II)
MRIHHLSCGTMCPVGGQLMYGRRERQQHRLVCHCLLIETANHGLVLVDTGLGLQDVRAPRERLSGFFRVLNRVRLIERETAIRQIEALGFHASDVRHIVLTHLDFDHAGGIEDFPNAAVHVLGTELDAARHHRDGLVARGRYRPQQWDAVIDWRTYDADGEPWFGFASVRALKGLPPEILMVPLVGHTWGHCGIAVQMPDRWLLHAGDSYFHAGEMDVGEPHCPPGLRAYQRLMEVDRRARLTNQERLRNLIRGHGSEVELFCAHDTAEFIRLRWTEQVHPVAEKMPRIESLSGGKAAPRRRQVKGRD